MPDSLYFDTCALNRLSDDDTQPRIREEAEAIERILELVAAGNLIWCGSSILQYEIEQNTDAIRRLDTLQLLSNAKEAATPSPSVLARAANFTAGGLASMDALHLAIAEQAGTRWLITTDDRFLRQAARLKIGPPEVVNPVDWIKRRHLWLLPNQS